MTSRSYELNDSQLLLSVPGAVEVLSGGIEGRDGRNHHWDGLELVRTWARCKVQ